jgi:hypothetical protein
MSPRFRQFLQQQQIQLVTWRELSLTRPKP